MRIGEPTRSYGMNPFMTRVSVGDRPVNGLVTAPPSRDVSENDDVQPYSIPRYGRSGRVEESIQPPTITERIERRIFVVV